jgi:hypothetical protein
MMKGKSLQNFFCSEGKTNLDSIKDKNLVVCRDGNLIPGSNPSLEKGLLGAVHAIGTTPGKE